MAPVLSDPPPLVVVVEGVMLSGVLDCGGGWKGGTDGAGAPLPGFSLSIPIPISLSFSVSVSLSVSIPILVTQRWSPPTSRLGVSGLLSLPPPSLPYLSRSQSISL